MGNQRFIIYAAHFDDRSGGTIVSHLLCQELNAIGEEAMVYRAQAPLFEQPLRAGRIARAFRERLLSWVRPYSSGPFNNPVARKKDLAGAIAVYTDVVDGNPLNADKVVRWLLNRPGALTGRIDYGPAELYFFYHEAFNDPLINPELDNRLTLTWVNQVYREMPGTERRGTCYLMKKGRGRPLVHDVTHSVCIDGMSHEEKNEVFNRTTHFFSYDLYTMYAPYAAICGCIPVIVPDPDLRKEDWLPDEQNRYGMAYGLDDVQWAIDTREAMIRRGDDLREQERKLVRRFADKCRERFGSGRS